MAFTFLVNSDHCKEEMLKITNTSKDKGFRLSSAMIFYLKDK